MTQIKAISAVVGCVIGIGVSRYGLPAELKNPDFQMVVTMAISSGVTYLVTYWSPKNRK